MKEEKKYNYTESWKQMEESVCEVIIIFGSCDKERECREL